MVHQAWIFNALMTLLALGFGLTGEAPERAMSWFALPSHANWIWAPICGLALAYASWQTLPKNRDHPLLVQLGHLPGVAFALAGLWSRVFPVHQPGLSLCAIVLTLGCAGWIVRVLVQAPPPREAEEHLFVDLPLSLFCGWMLIDGAFAATDQLARQGISSGAWELAMVLLLSVFGWSLSRYARLRPGFATGIAWGLAWTAFALFPHPIAVVAALGAAETAFAGTLKNAKRLA